MTRTLGQTKLNPVVEVDLKALGIWCVVGPRAAAPPWAPREGSLSSLLTILKDVSHFGGFRERGRGKRFKCSR